VADPTLATEKSGMTLNLFPFRLDLKLTVVNRFDRRFRIYDISDYGETIKTYKRNEENDVFDEMTLAGKGAWNR
jgi:hypothetical protein